MEKIEISKEMVIELIKQGFNGVEIAARLNVGLNRLVHFRYKNRILVYKLRSEFSKDESKNPKRVVVKNPQNRRTHLPCMIPVRELKKCTDSRCYHSMDCPLYNKRVRELRVKS